MLESAVSQRGDDRIDCLELVRTGTEDGRRKVPAEPVMLPMTPRRPIKADNINRMFDGYWNDYTGGEVQVGDSRRKRDDLMTVNEAAGRDERGLDALLDLVEREVPSPARTSSAVMWPRVFVIVPPSLRSAVERGVLRRFLRRATEGNPPMPVDIGVHSFSSLLHSVIGNDDGGRYVRPAIDMTMLRMAVAAELNGLTTERSESSSRQSPQAGGSFAAADRAARQIAELADAGLSSADLREVMACHPDDSRFAETARMMESVERRFGEGAVLPGCGAAPIADWVCRYGECLWFYCYGFTAWSGTELRVLRSMETCSHLRIVGCDAPLPPRPRSFAEPRSWVTAEAWRCRGERAPGMTGALPSDGPVIDMYAADDTIHEVRYVVRAIIDAVGRDDTATGGMEYGDVLVTARDIGPYRSLLAAEFAAHGIPVNAAPISKMADHPLARMVVGLCNASFYERDAACVLRVVRAAARCGAIGLSPDQLDDLADILAVEDPVTVWTSPGRGSIVDMVSVFIEDAHRGFLPTAGMTVREAAGAMALFLWNRLTGATVREGDGGEQRRDTSYADGKGDDTAGAGELPRELIDGADAVWSRIVVFLDDMVRYFGDDLFVDHVEPFVDNLKATLEGTPLGGAPEARNAVDILPLATPTRPHALMFLLGTGESQLFVTPHETGLLDDAERRLIADWADGRGDDIAAWTLREHTVERCAAREPAMVERVMRLTTRRLVVTYPRTLANATQRPSTLLMHLQVDPGVDPPSVDGDALHHDVPVVIRRRKPLEKDLATRLFTRPVPDTDGEANGQADGTTAPRRVFDTSVSAIETYYRNPYEYFLAYGLGLHPPTTFTFDAALEGTFYHAVLERAVTRWKDGHPGETPNPGAMHTLIDEVARLKHEPGRWSILDVDQRMRVLESSHRMRAVHRQLIDTLHRFVDDMAAERARNGDVPADRITPWMTERRFAPADYGGNGPEWGPLIPGMVHASYEGRDIEIPVRVNGRIDRIDRLDGMDGTGGDGIVILDYKSSPRRLFGKPPRKDDTGRATNVYHGHELQLFAYADAASRNTGLPVRGMFFIPVRKGGNSDSRIPLADAYKAVHDIDPADVVLPFAFPPGDETADSPRVRGPWRGVDLASSGVLVGDGIDVDGVERLSPEEFRAITRFVESRIVEAGQAIFDGRLPVRPYRAAADESTTGARYSDFLDVMTWELDRGDAYRLELPVTLQELKRSAADGGRGE